MNENARNVSLIGNIVPGLALACLLWLGYLVLQHFLLVIAWAIIIAFIMWPCYSWLKPKLNDNATLSAAIVTALIASVMGLVLFWLVVILQAEIRSVYQQLMTSFSNPQGRLPDAVLQIPWLGKYLQQFLEHIYTDEAGLKAQLLGWAKQLLGEFGSFLGGLGRNILKTGFVLITVFFCFRDGGAAMTQLKLGLSFLGEYRSRYLTAAGETARAVVYGFVLAALGQGLMAGLGYYVAGVEAPVFFGVITGILAFIPLVGSALIWIPCGLGLILSGQLWHGIGLLLWGAVVVSTIDNVIRPLVISGAGRVPLLVGVFGVFGGLLAFGAIGLFLGPIILSVLLSVWQAWVSQQQE
jgi:P-type Ca2+ transporter type 2C